MCWFFCKNQGHVKCTTISWAVLGSGFFSSWILLNPSGAENLLTALWPLWLFLVLVWFLWREWSELVCYGFLEQSLSFWGRLLWLNFEHKSQNQHVSPRHHRKRHVAGSCAPCSETELAVIICCCCSYLLVSSSKCWLLTGEKKIKKKSLWESLQQLLTLLLQHIPVARALFSSFQGIQCSHNHLLAT